MAQLRPECELVFSGVHIPMVTKITLGLTNMKEGDSCHQTYVCTLQGMLMMSYFSKQKTANHLVVLHWVNDYCILNSNTILDAHLLPHVDDILADCAKGKIWSKLDITNSFFQTLVHPDDIPLTAVTTPFGLYKWVIMPMGLKNVPPIHQH